MLSETELALIGSFNHTTVNRPEQTLSEMFAAQCERSPARVAIEFGTERVTYEQLQQSAHRVRDLLLHKGVAVGDRVALLYPRCPAQIAAIWGVMAAGVHIAL